MATKSTNLKTAVKKEARQAEAEVSDGDVKTVKQTTIQKQVTEDLPTYTRRSVPAE